MTDLRVRFRVAVGFAALIGCGPAGSSAPSAPSAPLLGPQVASVSKQEVVRAEENRRAELVAAHRELEVEQQSALATTCETPGTQERCEPSCYRPEPADPRAGKRFDRAEIAHLVCVSLETEMGHILFADEIGGSKVTARAVRGRWPKPHKKGTPEADMANDVAAALQPEVGRGDVIRVTSERKPVIHPNTNERLLCATVSHHVMSMRRPLDACGARGAIACEAAGNAAAHGINVVHYRLAEARHLHAAGKNTECQRAALEAIAVSRGLPRWRQYVTLNVDQWKAYPRYRTRFDGVLDEEALFATASGLGDDARVIHAKCGGPANPKTTVEQEQSFHTCW